MAEVRSFRASLSGSGSRLGWHVGILQAYLEDLRWTCTEYRGCSGGGLVAVAAACGHLTFLADLLRRMKTPDVYTSAGLWGLWKGYRYTVKPLEKLLRENHVPDWTPTVPVRLALYDVQAQAPVSHMIPVGDRLEKHWEAVLGTMAVPGVFPPRNQGRWVDGGVTDPIPSIEPMTLSTSHPWIVSVAMPVKLYPRPAPPENMPEVLRVVVSGLLAEIIREDLRWAVTQPMRVHVMSDAGQHNSLEFDPRVSIQHMAAGRTDVLSWTSNKFVLNDRVRQWKPR